MASPSPPVVLFGYDSSPFTQKVRLALRLKQITYTFVIVPSMMPRPVLHENFHLLYRKIPVLALGRDLYCDTSIILEVLEHVFPAASGYPSLYPPAADGRNYRPLIRGFASYWTDRPLFRVTTGLIPSSVWRTHFGVDRAELIGHKLDADKLEAKVPLNLSGLDMHLSLLEPLFRDPSGGREGAGGGGKGGPWIFSTQGPSLADVALYYQLDWGKEIAAGRGIKNLTGGGASDTNTEGTAAVFNEQRYPALWAWFVAFRDYIDALPETETKTTAPEEALRQVKACSLDPLEPLLIPTAAPPHTELDGRNGLLPGVEVTVAPDDTGRADPTYGTLLALTPEEVVIKPQRLGTVPPIDVRVHFPRLGFTVRRQAVPKL